LGNFPRSLKIFSKIGGGKSETGGNASLPQGGMDDPGSQRETYSRPDIRKKVS